eukprot:1147595-Pelagomonas_calceolata.AAC.4
MAYVRGKHFLDDAPAMAQAVPCDGHHCLYQLVDMAAARKCALLLHYNNALHSAGPQVDVDSQVRAHKTHPRNKPMHKLQ